MSSIVGEPPQPPDQELPTSMEDHLEFLVLRGRLQTARSRRIVLRAFSLWLTREGVEPLVVTTTHLRAYLAYLATVYRTPSGELLKRSTQALRLRTIKAYYRWLEQRGLIVADPSRRLIMPESRSRVVVREPLSLQEATALMQTQAQAVVAARTGSYWWAVEFRYLGMLAIGLSTGRRIAGILGLRAEHLDCERRELRVEREKGRTGRVLPVAGWAIDVLRLYAEQARPVLAKGQETPWMFPGKRPDRPLDPSTPITALEAMVARTVDANPDLVNLPGKHITWHSLRVSFATMLFTNGGADIRTVNELMLHRLLSSTARYTPIAVQDLRRVCLTAHPRA